MGDSFSRIPRRFVRRIVPRTLRGGVPLASAILAMGSVIAALTVVHWSALIGILPPWIGNVAANQSFDEETMAAALLAGFGAAILGFLLARELTRREQQLRAATEEARQAQESLRAVLDYSPQPMLLVEDDRVTVVNPAAERFLGTSPLRLLGMSPAELLEFGKATYENGVPIELDTFPLADPSPVIVRVFANTPAERWMELSVIPESRPGTRILLTGRDITEAHRLETMREEIFSLVSHDLRAPLTVVQGYLDILARPLQPEARDRALQSARHNAEKMAGLLADLLDAAAPEEFLAPKVLDRVSLADLAHDVASSMQATAPAHTLEVVCDGEPCVAGEERRLRQALVNLVNNAVKYSPEGTTVTIRARCSGEAALLAVDDEGPGVPPDAREAVFQRYGRLRSTAEGKPGLGLGLHIVRVIAEKHGGTASVESAPGGGARFLLEFPRFVEPLEDSAFAAPA